MKGNYAKWLIALVVLLLVAVVIDIGVRLNTKDRPCLAIPTRFILEEPQCAEKLIRAANVSGVRIVTKPALGITLCNQSPILTDGQDLR